MSLRSILETASSDNTLVSIYVDSDDWGNYSVGYVDLVTSTHVRLRAISKYGEAAGFEVRPLSEIVKVEYDGKYERKIEVLIKNQGQIFNEIAISNETSGDLVRDALQQSLDDSVVVVAWGNDPDDSVVGYVEKIEPEFVTFRLINGFGEDDGFSIIDISEVSSIDFNTQSEQVRSFLYRNRTR